MTVRYLILWPTAACDLSCPYCYRRDRRGGRMSSDIADAAIDLLAEGVRTTGQPAHVQLAGGEPTLVPSLIEHVADRVAGIRGGRVTCGIQTNAARLDDDMATMFKRRGVRVGVSVDGPPSVQQKARGSAAQTFRGLLALVRAGVPVRVTTVLSAFNVEHLGDLALTLGGLPNVTGFGIDPLVSLGSAAGRADLVPTDDAVVTGIRALYRRLAQVNAIRAKPLVWRELETVRAALRRSCASVTTVDPSGRTLLPLSVPNRPYCHAAVGESMAVAPDGSVYPCSQSVGDPASRAGTVHHVDWHRLKERFSQDVHTLKGPCRHCTLAGRCPGDCPSRVEANNLADPERSRTPLTCLINDTLARLETAS
ncbi:radical SAM protein [Cutibacterium sp.]|uniref:radical SAM/SPASM domain-containing protein n=1 Tax=Cutibacterium sp. TaxID=1912221 RepID=UPI0026DB81DB|nr:radical SAM protein [Cutibacterium sp.]MDO4412622.1 radical SAM protein [Cutibacterium sp.]